MTFIAVVHRVYPTDETSQGALRDNAPWLIEGGFLWGPTHILNRRVKRTNSGISFRNVNGGPIVSWGHGI